MDEQPDILSSGPEWDGGGIRWPRPGRRGWIVILGLAILLASLGVTVILALRVAHQDDTISQLRTAVRNAPAPAPASASATAASPTVSGSAAFTLPNGAGGSFSVVAVAVRAGPGSTPVTWLFVYGQHVTPGQRYGLLSDTCGGQYVAAYGVAAGTADRNGDLTIVAPNLDINPQAPDVWIQLYRWADGAPLGGVQGPLTGSGARTFQSAPSC
jgi:hypothetical protein